jgi:hypothetical protein
MERIFSKKLLAFLLVIMTFMGCDLLAELDKGVDFQKLKGTWIDKESYAMSFIDFYADNQASFCTYKKAFERRDTFNYRVFNDSIAIHFIGDKESPETLHKLVFNDNNTIAISNLTTIPEHPDKVYYRKNIVTTTDGNVINISLDELYYDRNYDFRLQIDSVLNDSRCPNGAECVWAGNAQVRLDLIVEGNYHYQFSLNSNPAFKQDTLIRGIKYKLIDVLPYPDINKQYNYQNYRVNVSATKQ